MRALSLAVLMLPSIALADVASDTSPTDTDAGTECAAEGDACTTTDGEDGTCDADLACAASDDGGGCNTAGAPVAGGVTLLSLGLLGARRARRPKACCTAE